MRESHPFCFYILESIPPNGRQSIEKEISFDSHSYRNDRHYWYFNCKIGDRYWSTGEKKVKCTVWECDKGSKVQFTLIRDGSDGIRLNLTLPSGNTDFKMQCLEV